MLPIKNLLWLAAVLAVVSCFLVGCETIKGTANGAYKGAQKDIEQVVSAAKGEAEEPKGLGIVVDKVMKTDQWIKDNMW